jgi:hypothetical protein
MGAAIVPPKIDVPGKYASIGPGLPGRPTHTAVETCGVYPTNHASVESWVVPVFPATGRPIAAALPVPPGPTTRSSIAVTRCAISGAITWRHCGR